MSEPKSVYSVDQSREIMGRIRDIRKSLTSGQQEKLSLMVDLARLKDEFLINKLQTGSGSSSDVSTHSIPNLQEVASQTDLSGDVSILGSGFQTHTVSTHSIPNLQEVASQTDLSGDTRTLIPSYSGNCLDVCSFSDPV